MKKLQFLTGLRTFFAAGSFFMLVLAGCGDDDDFSPVARNRGYDYAYTSTKDLSKTPCNEMREGREAVIGRDKDRYECIFDEKDSAYLWVGYGDTLTAEGREFSRPESSSSSDEESSDSEGSSSSRYSSSSSLYSSSSYSSSSRYSSSSFYLDTAWSFNKSSVGQGSITFTLTSKDELLNPDVEYGVMTDERDGQVYRTVIVGNRVWMAENLNFAGNDDYPLVLERSACFNFDDDNCALLGRLYSREAALDNVYCMLGAPCDIGDTLVRGVCPKGWHIPSSDEASALVYAFGDDLDGVRSVKGWGTSYGVGTNTSGFSMPASGCLDFDDYNFKNAGKTGYVWAYIKGSSMRYLIFRGSDHDVIIHSGYTDNIFVSVRCISDDTLNIALSSASIRSSSSDLSSSSVSSSSFSSSSVSSSSAKSSSSVSSSSVSSSSAKSSSSESSSSMSSSSEESSSSFDKTVLFNSAVSYGEMTDGRDGKTYRTLYIAGHTWMAENLNFADSSKLPILKGNNRCYDDDPAECVAFGRLYSREAALNDSACTCYNGSCPSMSGNVQGVCPDGWHIPSKSEAEQLANLDGNQAISLNSSYGWDADHRGNNSTGMSFVGTGLYRRQSGYVGFQGKGKYINLWVYDASSPNEKWYLMDLGKGSNGNGVIAVEDEAGYDPFYTVRCIKN